MKHKLLVLTAAPALAALLALTVSAQEVAKPTPSPEVAQFQKLEDTWSLAIANKDQYAMENLLSPAFIGIASDGDVATRNEEVANLFQKGQPDLVSVEQKVVNVRVVEDLAVVDGTYIVRHKVSGTLREQRGIYTHVYQRTRSSWVCIHAQRTPVVNQSPQDQKPKAQKKSNAELPFHVPFFHKGEDSSQPATQTGTTQPSS